MSIYSYEEAFGDWDKTTTAMRNAVQEWFLILILKYYHVIILSNYHLHKRK